MPKEFLVIYEEADTGDQGPDELVLDIHTLRHAFRKQVEVEADVRVDMENRSDANGAIGLVVSVVGAVLAIIGLAVFVTTYPQEWYAGQAIIGDSVRRLTATLLTLGGLALVVGTILTASGRRVTAKGRIEEAHIVSKEPHSHTELR